MQTAFEILIRDAAAVGVSAAMLGLEIGTRLLRSNFIMAARRTRSPAGPDSIAAAGPCIPLPIFMRTNRPTSRSNAAYEDGSAPACPTAGQGILPHGRAETASSEMRTSMESEYPKENTPRTPVSPVEGTRELNDKPNFKKTDEPWKKPTEDSHDGPKPDLEKEQELKTG